MKSADSMSRRGSPWLVAEIRLLGKIPDSILARRRKRTIKEVVAMREQLRKSLNTGPRRWTRREILLLGTLNDQVTASRLIKEVHPKNEPDPLTRGWIAGRTQLLVSALNEELRGFMVSRKPWR